MNIILLAPSATGKGTQAEMLKEKYNFNHISIGQLLRDEAQKQDEVGKEIAEFQKKGILVADEIVIEVLRKKILTLNNNGIIFDGYPRTIKQAELLEKLLNEFNTKIDYVLYLDITKEEAMKRALGRVTCSECNKIYSIYYDVFEREGYCNECGGKTFQRNDDTEETFNNKFDLFLQDTTPLIGYYEDKGILRKISVKNVKEETFDEILKVLE